jgi:hypothetical protein
MTLGAADATVATGVGETSRAIPLTRITRMPVADDSAGADDRPATSGLRPLMTSTSTSLGAWFYEARMTFSIKLSATQAAIQQGTIAAAPASARLSDLSRRALSRKAAALYPPRCAPVDAIAIRMKSRPSPDTRTR